MTSESIEEIRRLGPDLPASERRREIDRIAGAGKGSPFDPLPAAAKSVLNEWYLRDCEDIERLGIQCIF